MTTTTFEQFVMNDPAMNKIWEEEVCYFMGGLEELGNHFSGDPTRHIEDYEQAVELLWSSADSLCSLLNKFSYYTQNQRIAEIDLVYHSCSEVNKHLIVEREKCEKVLDELGKPLGIQFDNLPSVAENAAAFFLTKAEAKKKRAKAKAEHGAVIRMRTLLKEGVTPPPKPTLIKDAT